MNTGRHLGRSAACAIIVLVWGAIYLPGLGLIDIKGEEIRRIMPGVYMLETGDWVMPQFNGQPYLRKPPLVNWAVALSIKAFGRRTIWTARFPSVISVLAMALVMFESCAEWLGVPTALAAVCMLLTSAGLVEKGRLAEIEAIYISLFGMATACWMGWVAVGKSRWLVWSVTGFLLGLGLLAKGPPHLLFFYALAASIAFLAARRRRSAAAAGAPAWPEPALLSWAHLAGLAIMLGLFALWCVPYLRETARLDATGIWARQMQQRLGEGDRGTILKNFGRSLVNFLPWALGLPLFWKRSVLDRLVPRDRLLVEAARWPIVLCAFALMFVPGMLPRYTLPLLAPYALLLALLLRTATGDRALRWPLAAAALTGAGMCIFGLVLLTGLGKDTGFSDMAGRVNAVVPPGSSICIFDPGVQPEIFYFKAPFYFADSVKTLPDKVPCLYAPGSSLPLLRSRFETTRILGQVKDRGGKDFYVLQLAGRR